MNSSKLKLLLSNKWISLILKVLFLLMIIAFSYSRARKETDFGDFHVFWQAGRDLWASFPLYETRSGLRDFIYPPFAALVFSVLSIFPFKIATFLFFLINFATWFLIFRLMANILSYQGHGRREARNILIISFLLSFKLFWNNIMMVQSNEIVLVFSLLGIYYAIRERTNLAIVFFALATSLKLTPFFFFFWLVIRSKDKRVFFKSALSGAVCILLPMFVSGFSRGWIDLKGYAQDFVFKYVLKGEVSLSYANQALNATLFRMFSPLQAGGEPLYTIFNLGVETTGLIYKVMFWLILLSMFAVIIRNRFLGRKIHLYETSLIFLVSHLVSGVSWKAHLISLGFVFVSWFSLKNQIQSNLLKKLWWGITGYMAVVALLGKELVGQTIQRQLGAYGYYTWMMVLIFVFFVLTSIIENKENKA